MSIIFNETNSSTVWKVCIINWSSSFNHLWRNHFLSFCLLLVLFVSSCLKLSYTENSSTSSSALHIREFAVSICRENLAEEYAVAICNENLPQEFAVGICHRNLLWKFVAAVCRGFFCISDNPVLHIWAILLIWKQKKNKKVKQKTPNKLHIQNETYD